jgi:lipopolysaccharide transport system permease protein
MFRNLQELWQARALVMALISRHLRARYRGSVFGFMWSFLNPLCLIAVYSLVFKYYIRYQDVEHYTVFLFAGLLPWIWFTSALTEATSSITGSGHLITKALFPPHVLPVVAVLTNLLNYIFSLPILFLLMYFTGLEIPLTTILIPLIVLIELIFLIGLSLAMSALNVYLRDVQHILGNVLTLLFFLTPVIYPVKSIPEKYQFTLYLNPIALMTDIYHRIILDGEWIELNLFLYLGAVSLLTLIIGNLIFNAYREEFPELV